MKARKMLVMLLLMALLLPQAVNVHHTRREGSSEGPGKGFGSGKPPSGTKTLSFTKVTDEAGLGGISTSHFAWGDYNNDDLQDLLLGTRLYRNMGPPGWNFTEVTSQSGIQGGGKGVWADYDNDGYLDLYTTGNRLWRNAGPPDWNFTDETLAAGNLTDPYPTTAAGWGDHDRDGDLDLYVVNGEKYNDGNPVFYPDIFYQNNGDGTFTDRTVEAKLDTSHKKAYGRSVNWGDYNNDGYLDIHVGNYRLCPNYLWRNNGDGTFTDVADETGTAGVYDPDMYYDKEAEETYGDGTWGPTYGHTIGSAWGDLDNDGDLDLWDSNLVHKYVGPTSWPSMPYDIRGYVCDDSKIYRNNGAPWFNFTDIRERAGIPKKPIGGQGTYQGDELWSGVAMGDYDNDGDLDVFVPQIYDLEYAPSLLYRNNDDGTFTEVAGSLGLRSYNTYGGSWCDYDNDGDLDLFAGGKRPFVGEGEGTYEVQLFRNDGNSNHWISVKLEGIESNSFGIGARVKVTTRDDTQMREVEGGMGSHGQQNSLPVEFGLGDNGEVREVEVVWPDGKVQLVKDPSVDGTITVVEDTGAPEITEISVSKRKIDEEEEITFSGKGEDDDGTIGRYEWDFDGDGRYDWNSTTSATVTHGFREQGNYRAKLRIWDDTGTLGNVQSTDHIEVSNIPPVADLRGEVRGWEGQELHFSAEGTQDTEYDLGNMLYRMDFDDGNATNWVGHTDFNHTYWEKGIYTVRLTVKDDDGETSGAVLEIEIENRLPEPVIRAPSSGLEDEKIPFSARCNDTLQDLGKIQYHWDFGDGETLGYTGQNRTEHTYTERGSFEVELSVRDRHGAVNKTTHPINISNVPPVCTSSKELAGEEDSPLLFQGEGYDTMSDLGDLRYRWHFGDGNHTSWSNRNTAEHTYRQSGNYTALFEARDDDLDIGEWRINVTIDNVEPGGRLEISPSKAYEDDEIRFSAQGEDTESDEDDLEFRLDLGDGNITDWRNDNVFYHSYERTAFYKVKLWIRDNGNATYETEGYVTVENRPPTAEFTFSPVRDLDESTMITFTSNSADTPSDADGLNHTWSMGDEGTFYGATVSLDFRTSGKHRILLKIRDDDGAISTASRTIRVENIPPVAVLNVSAPSVDVGREVLFDAGGSRDSPHDMEDLEFEWRIGRIRKSGERVAHRFTSPGRYTVYLTVTDGDGDEDEASVRITVRERKTSGEDRGGAGILLYGVIAAVLITGALIFVFVVIRKREPREDLTSGAGEVADTGERPEVSDMYSLEGTSFGPPGEGEGSLSRRAGGGGGPGSDDMLKTGGEAERDHSGNKSTKRVIVKRKVVTKDRSGGDVPGPVGNTLTAGHGTRERAGTASALSGEVREDGGSGRAIAPEEPVEGGDGEAEEVGSRRDELESLFEDLDTHSGDP